MTGVPPIRHNTGSRRGSTRTHRPSRTAVPYPMSRPSGPNAGSRRVPPPVGTPPPLFVGTPYPAEAGLAQPQPITPRVHRAVRETGRISEYNQMVNRLLSQPRPASPTNSGGGLHPGGIVPSPVPGNGGSLLGQGTNPRPVAGLHQVQDPIDVSSGQMVMHEVDAEFLGALPLVFERTHFSAFRAGRWLGESWMSTLDERVEVHADQVCFAAADGTIQVFPRPHGEAWVTAERGPLRRLAEAPEAGFVIEDRARGRMLFFGRGTGVLPVLSISDRNGNHIVVDHDERGVPTEVWHSGGYRVRVDTDDGLVSGLRSVADDGSEVELVRYGYDERRRLTEVTNASGLPFRYSYDDAGRITAWTDRNDEWYRYTYDDAGRVVRTEGAGGCLTGTMEYDEPNRVTYATDSLGHRRAFHLNEHGQVVREVDPLGGVTTSEWDAWDRLLAETDPLGRRTSYRHDERGDVVAVVRPDGSELLVERDELGLPVRMVEAPGVETRWEYDERGNLTGVVEPDGATTTYTYDEWGHLASVTDAAGVTLTVVSDATGLPVSVTGPDGAVTRYAHDRFGRLVAVTAPNGATEQFGYTVDGALAWHRGADGAMEEWLFDGEGNNRVHADTTGAVTHGEVGHFDLPSAHVNADGSRVELAYDTELRLVAVTNERGLVWRYEYDAAGNLVRETDFGGVTRDYRYDAAGQLTEVRDAAGGTVVLRRDLLGNVVEEITATAHTRYAYSALGHLLVADDGTTRVEYTRDPVGRVLTETVDGRTVHSEYDAAGRRVRRRTPSGAESVWEYDAAGLPAAVHTAGGSMRFAYDLAGREVSRTFGSAAIFHSWSPADLVTGQSVVGAGRVLGQQRFYAYRPDGLPIQVADRLTGSRSFTVDVRGRVTDVVGQGWTERYAYDVTGRLVDAVWPAPAEEDRLGARSGPGTVVTAAGRVRYTYDACGRLVSRDHGNSRSWQYTWGPLDRLVAVRTPDGTRWRYTYDPFGRRVRKERLATDGATALERVDFVWDDDVLVEQIRSGKGDTETTVWDYEPGSFRPLLQRHLTTRAPQRVFAVVTDLSGAPAELVDDQGGIEWHARISVHGVVVEESGGPGTPLRFQGQYFDAETGLHYNHHRYYDPALGRYLSPDPIGLTGGPDPHAYVHNPHAFADPLGLAPSGCGPSNPATPMRMRSPGGRLYEAATPAGRYANSRNREAAGYTNPHHDHNAMLSLWRDAAMSPPPPGVTKGSKAEKDWLMDPQRHFAARMRGSTTTVVIRGHSAGVLGHDPSAGTHWNAVGMYQPREANLAHNKQTSTYHGIEPRKLSDASGSREVRYESPNPGRGHRSYWDLTDPNYTGGPWPSWRRITTPPPSFLPPPSPLPRPSHPPPPSPPPQPVMFVGPGPGAFGYYPPVPTGYTPGGYGYHQHNPGAPTGYGPTWGGSVVHHPNDPDPDGLGGSGRYPRYTGGYAGPGAYN